MWRIKFIVEDYSWYRVKIKKVIDFIISSVTLCLTKRLYCNCKFVFWNYFICSLTLYLTMWLQYISQSDFIPYITIVTLIFIIATSYLTIVTLYLALWLYLSKWFYILSQLQHCFSYLQLRISQLRFYILPCDFISCSVTICL